MGVIDLQEDFLFRMYDLEGYDPDTNGLHQSFGWWCLAHNFDQATTLHALASISWEKGFDAGTEIADFSNRPTNVDPSAITPRPHP